MTGENSYSSEHKQYLKRIRRRRQVIVVSQILFLAALLALWELASSSGWINEFIAS